MAVFFFFCCGRRVGVGGGGSGSGVMGLSGPLAIPKTKAKFKSGF